MPYPDSYEYFGYGLTLLAVVQVKQNTRIIDKLDLQFPSVILSWFSLNNEKIVGKPQ